MHHDWSPTSGSATLFTLNFPLLGIGGVYETICLNVLLANLPQPAVNFFAPWIASVVRTEAENVTMSVFVCTELKVTLVKQIKSHPCLKQSARSHNPLPPPYCEHRRQQKWLILCLPEGNPGKMKLEQNPVNFQLLLPEGT